MIDEKVLLQSRPEALNDMMDMELQNQKGGYNNGWNDCLFYFIDIIKKQPKVGDWIPFVTKNNEITSERPLEYEVILVTDGHKVWSDLWSNLGGYFGLESEVALEGLAWMPMPELYKEKENDSTRDV